MELNYLEGSDKKYSKYLSLDRFINKVIFEHKMQYTADFVYSTPYLLEHYTIAHHRYNLELRESNLIIGSINGARGYSCIKDKESHKAQFNSLKTEEFQSIAGTSGGNKNVETGWWDEFIKRGMAASHAPASCKYCGLDSTRGAITKDHDENCNQKPDIIMPMLNALPEQFLTGMLVSYFNDLGIGETLQSTIENSKWFKPVGKIRTYTIFERGENYYKYINEYPNTTYEPVTSTPDEWCDKITDKVTESKLNNILNETKSLYKILPNTFTYNEACTITEDHGFKHASLTKIINSRHLLSIHGKNKNIIIYSKNQKVIKSLKDLEPGLTQKQKTDNYKKMVSELSNMFILESNKVDVNKMYLHVLKIGDSSQIGSFKNKQKLTKALQKIGLELEFINGNHDNEIHEKYIKVLNLIKSNEFTVNDFKKAVKLSGIKKISQTCFLNNKKYCIRIHDGVRGSKINVPIYKKVI